MQYLKELLKLFVADGTAQKVVIWVTEEDLIPVLVEELGRTF